MKRYAGERRDGRVRVMVWETRDGSRLPDVRPLLPPSQGVLAGPCVVADLPPFDWGRPGPGALTLARAILSDCLGRLGIDQSAALAPAFEWSIVRGLARDEWELGDEAVHAFVELAPLLDTARLRDLWQASSAGQITGMPVAGLRAAAVPIGDIAYHVRA